MMTLGCRAGGRRVPWRDIAIAREYKRAGRPVTVLLGRYDIECTMYISRIWREICSLTSRTKALYAVARLVATPTPLFL